MKLVMAFIRLTKRAARNALKKPVISKPGTNPATAYKRNAFITKVKNPRLRMFMGKVRRSSMGLTKAFKIPNTRAAKTRTCRLST
jgi:hypothetical protein